MKLVLTAEQRQLRESVHAFLAGTVPMSRVREIAESGEPGTGYDRPAWQRMAGELGLTGLVIPEAHGGSGAGWVEMAVVCEELGASLAPVPYLASAVLAATTLLELGDGAADGLLSDIAAGRAVATLALAEDGGAWDPAAVRTTAKSAGDGEYLLEGGKPYVLNGAEADLLLVVAALDGRPEVFAVGPAPVVPGLTRTPLVTLDATRPQARLTFDGTPARLIPAADATAALDRVLDRARVALAAEQLGGMRRCLDVIVDYARIRVQFGRPVGSFQAVKHKLADMRCVLEQAESIVRHAAWAADESPGDVPVAAALAQSFCGPAYFRIARDHLLLHGGIGFTWEHDAHLYYKRAKSAELLLGAPRHHRAALAERLGLG